MASIVVSQKEEVFNLFFSMWRGTQGSCLRAWGKKLKIIILLIIVMKKYLFSFYNSRVNNTLGL